MTRLYITEDTQEFADTDEIEDYFEEKSGKDLVKAHMEWRGRVTTDYVTRQLNIDPFEAEKILESLEEEDFCYTRDR